MELEIQRDDDLLVRITYAVSIGPHSPVIFEDDEIQVLGHLSNLTHLSPLENMTDLVRRPRVGNRCEIAQRGNMRSDIAHASIKRLVHECEVEKHAITAKGAVDTLDWCK